MPRRPGQWLVLLRAALVVVAAIVVGVTDFPSSYRPWAWAVVGFFALVTVASGVLSATELGRSARVRARALLIVCDAVVGIGIIAVFSYQAGEPYRALYLIPIAEAALRFGLLGGVIGGAVMTGSTLVIDALGPGLQLRAALVRVLVGMLSGIVVGRLRDTLNAERALAESRAAEAERLRDELGHRVDVLETANRCARALGSSLELDEAFGAFIRELRGLVPFERTAIVLVEGDTATTMATAGLGASEVFPPGNMGPIKDSVLERVLDGHIVVRRDLAGREYPEDDLLLALGLRSELVAPLLLGARTIGMLTLSRDRVEAFSEDEIELVSLLGRLVATAVQNIRAYEAERRRVEELARLSELRADFVSLVSHELRSPMAAVIGAARTLQDRWRMLTAEQRESFLALIGDETSRLAELVGDVLDTSRIEAGTFSYRFEEVELGRVIDEAVEAAVLAQQEVAVLSAVRTGLPAIRGDRARLRQVLGNLIENAVKYSPEGGEVRVSATAGNGAVQISVRDSGPGIPRDQQARIFEKFGRADVEGGSKPGTGLGLFIARSIAEAHGGSLEVSSGFEPGATFTLA
ncbi:MAG TPA: GAF domain-containing sensor histidine kinase, partial [Gaiellaceae bacterium]|nr:GAF domain-containing sensor histidine kinase [Gaiellaceae bacterium]